MAAPTTPALPNDDSVNLVNPGGQLVSVPGAQAKAALGFGYRQPTADETKDFQGQQTYGAGVGNELKAGALGAAGAASFGAVPEALAQTGIVPSEEQAGLAKYNPHARMVGESLGIAGGIGAAMLTGGASAEAGAAAAAAKGAGPEAAAMAGKAAAARFGLADALNPISGVGKIGKGVAGLVAKALPSAETSGFAKAVLSRAGAASAGAAAEGAIFGAGQSLDEHAMGDPDAMGEHLLHNIGYGAALAGLAGGSLSVGGDLFGKLKSTIKDWRNPKNAKAGYQANIRAGADHESTIPPDGGEPPPPPTGVAPGSLDEMKARNKTATYAGQDGAELLSKAELVKANELVGSELENPVHPIQLESLSSQLKRDSYKAFQEMPTEDAQATTTYEANQKRELVHKLGSEIQSIAPTETLTEDATKGGESLVSGFTDHYQAEKDALKPLFKKFDEIGVNPLKDFATKPAPLEDAIEGASQYLKVKDGKLTIDPYSPDMPFSRAAHGAMQDIVDAANKPNMTLDGVRNVRDSIKDRINLTTPTREVAQLGALRKTLMDYMQEAVEEHTDDLDVRNTFKRYAINEQNRGIMEKVMGGSISDRASFAKTIKPEDVLDKLFANSVTINAAKEILPANVFNKAVGDYLSMKRALFTDNVKNGFSSNRFYSSILKNKFPELSAALAGQPQKLERLNAFNQMMRILPDSAPINPPQTAKTLNLFQIMNKLGSAALHPLSAAKELAGTGLEHLAQSNEQKRIAAVMNEVLAGKSMEDAQASAEEHMGKNAILGYVQKASEKTGAAIEKGAKAIFGAAPAAAALGSKKDSSHDKLRDDIHSLNENPENILDRLNEQTKLLYAHAPESTGALNGALIRANQFLTAKMPKTPPPTPLGGEFQPSQAEKAKFERYSSVIENPISVMSTIHDGTITPESVEALSTVYPKMYDQMRGAVFSALADHKSKDGPIPYSAKMGLTLFMGQPMDGTLTPQSILSHQPPPQTPQMPSAPQGKGKSKGALSKLGKSASLYATGDQSIQMEKAKNAT